jgi:xanthine dehydrogenase accessory factor
VTREPTDNTAFDPLLAAENWLKGGEPVAMASVIEAWGSAPVPIGGQMVIASGERFQGSVSGGCIEADVIAEATDVLASGKPQVLSFGIADETAWRAGLACGGKLRILVTRLTPDEGLPLFAKLSTARGTRQAAVIETRLNDGHLRLVTATAGESPAIAEALASGASKLHEDAQSGALGGTFLQAIAPAPRLFVVGATHVAQVLAKLAQTIGYQITIIDPRSAFTADGRFDASIVETAWPETALKTFTPDPFTAVVTLTHVGHIDDEALAISLRSPCRYIGALGSRKTHAKRVERLVALGFTDADIARIKSPVGLNIGAETPAEIAVAILGEVIAAFRGGKA